ncbi:MAG: DNA gyrase subunit B [Christensenellaceae bacterium]|jgi:DNA gyrase subunit B|nr:DNA gyrase subunit B [Christensenellaceae bacterium]
MQEEKSYDSSSIQVLEGLNAVRMRPGMYIGTTGIKGMHHLLWEIVDNAIDEVANGFGDTMTVTIYPDNSASVEDNGRGIPVDLHKTLKVSGVEVVFTQLHAGGKFGNENYSFSGGLHGVGASVTNALSEWTEVTVNKDGKQYFIKFAPSKDKDGKMHYGVATAPLKEVGKTAKKGTFVKFLPDGEMFRHAEFSHEIIVKRLRELAYLNKGVRIIFKDERVSADNTEILPTYEFKYDGGLADFCEYLNDNKTSIYAKPLIIEGQTENMPIAFAMQHTDQYTESVFSYVNNIPTSEGGTHETGFKAGITRAFNQIGKQNGFIKEKDTALMGEDYREGLTAVLSIKMREVQFEGQTKTKLGNPEAKSEVEGFVYSKLIEYFSNLEKDSKKKNLFDTIMTKAKGAARVREAARRAKDNARKLNSIDGGVLIGKLSSCTGRKPEFNEIFIVEGDSAGGTAKQGRDRSIQAILPLRGKPLNAEKKRLDQVLDNEEFRTLISALGTGIGEDFNLDNLKYHKVIILADADQDGAHIRSILLTFFYRYMRDLVAEGHVYIGMPPLYKVWRKDWSAYCYDDIELKKVTATQKGSIQRYKGLGEMNADQLWETTMSPQTRKLCRVSIDDAAEAERLITTLMGDNIEARKEYISRHANFNKEETIASKAVKSKMTTKGGE